MDGDGWMDRFRRFQVRTRRRRECAAQLPARTRHLAQRQRPSIIGDTNGRVPRLHTLAGVVEVVAARCAGPGCSPLRLPVQDWQKPQSSQVQGVSSGTFIRILPRQSSQNKRIVVCRLPLPLPRSVGRSV